MNTLGSLGFAHKQALARGPYCDAFLTPYGAGDMGTQPARGFIDGTALRIGMKLPMCMGVSS